MQSNPQTARHSRQPNNPWLVSPDLNASAPFRLYCFAYAGGNANVFRSWPALLDKRIELVAIQYPGRATRFKDGLIDSMEVMLEQLEHALRESLKEKPYAFFGHSMGAGIAYELSRRLHKKSLTQKINLPARLIVSGRRGPGAPIEADKKPIHKLPKDAFIERLKNLNGTPEELLQHEDLMNLMEPILRNDFKLVETWKSQEGEALPLPLSIYGGENDEHINLETLDAWKRESKLESRVVMFPGDHFYLHQHEQLLVNEINKDLMAYLQ